MYKYLASNLVKVTRSCEVGKMSKQREAFKAFLELQQYCDNTLCEDCCFCLGNDHDNEGYCVFDGGLAQADDEREEISKRVYFLEQLELEMGKK